jgi:hypothetical protein
MSIVFSTFGLSPWGTEVTTPEYWDCECEENYIHPKSQKKCHICNTFSKDQPDSRISEVIDSGFILQKEK